MEEKNNLLFRSGFFFMLVALIIIMTSYNPIVGVIMTILVLIYYYNKDYNTKIDKEILCDYNEPDKIHLEANMRPKCSKEDIKDKVIIKSNKEPKAYNPQDENKNVTLL